MAKSESKKDPTLMTPDEREKHWFETVYQGDKMPQLTLRAVLMGSVLGGVMSLSNLYIGLKTGWGLGVAITSCIMSYTIYKTLMTVFPRLFRTEMSILENNCMQSTATSAGVSTGGTMVSAISAYLIVTNTHIGWVTLVLWTFFLAVLGVFMAIPMKRQMINIEQLKFPSGIATAETLKSLHAEGKEAQQKARSLFSAMGLGTLIAWFRDVGKPFAIPASLSFPGSISGFSLAKWTVSFDMSAIMFAGGAIMGWKTAWSMLLGAFLNYVVLAPRMMELGAIDSSKIGYRAIMQWSTWVGSSIMVTSGLLAFALQWKTISRAITGAAKTIGKKANKALANPLDDIEVPFSWFAIGTSFAAVGCMCVLYFAFGTSPWMGLVAIIVTFFLSLVACRTTGETDITPIGAMGKITQLMFGILAPSNIVTNLMTASVTAGAAGASADLLSDLKSGYILGANPRKQFIAQLAGVFAGTIVVVPAFYILVPDAAVLGTDRWPAPAAQVWAAVARLLANGFNALHPAARNGMFLGALFGILMPTIEMLLPQKVRKYLPSATGIGLAFVIPFFNSLSMFLGAFVALVLQKKMPKFAEKYVIPVASGIIAGESIMGILIAILQARGII